jgi:hypothetical protein
MTVKARKLQKWIVARFIMWNRITDKRQAVQERHGRQNTPGRRIQFGGCHNLNDISCCSGAELGLGAPGCIPGRDI